jgi:hypothetical protein
VLVLEDEGINDTLVLPGVIVDVSSSVHPAPDILSTQTQKWKFMRKLRSIGKRLQLRNVKNGETTCEAPYQTLQTLITPCQDVKRLFGEFAGRFEAGLRNGNKANDLAYIHPYSIIAIIRCMRRLFVITEECYFGLGRSITKPGNV